MRIVPAMTDMKRSNKEKEEIAENWMPSPSSVSDYPCGLSISLTQDELDKLNLDDEDVEPGDLIHMHCMAVVTSVSKNNNEQTGPQCRIELQITHIAAEDEEEEDKENEEQEDSVTSKLYR